MLHHWDLLAGSFCFAGEIHMETHSHLYRITLQSASYYLAICVILPCNLRHITLQSASYYTATNP